MDISITGGNGFVGKLITKHFGNKKVLHINRNQISINKKSKIIVHLAGIAHDISSKYSYNDYLIGNFELTKKIFKEFLNSNASTFIFFSTSKIYGDNGFFNEESRANPITHYAYSKLKAENFLIENFKIKSKNIIILRPSLIYSNMDKMKGNLNLLKKWISFFPLFIFPNINNQRSYCSIENIYSLIDFLTLNKLESGVYNISDTNAISTYDLVRFMSKQVLFISLSKSLSKILIFILYRLPKINKLSSKLFNDFVIDNTKLKRATGLSFEKQIIK
tara:strand:+ start:383 stop:1210 length:828 start_codon:yes stop_codon:yes gene_type:complete